MHLLVLGDPDAPHLSELSRLPADVRVTVGLDVDALRPAVSDVTGVLLMRGNHAQLKPLWRELSALKWVHSLSAGVEQVLFDELIHSNVILTNARGVYAPSLGEWVLGAMLFFSKGHRRLVKAQEARRWERFTVDELAGKTVVILGYGEIGQEVARRARAMEMQVVGVRRRPAPDGVAQDVVGELQMLDVLPRADVVVCALPSTLGTRKLIGGAQFKAMEKHPLFINVGRGDTVDERALMEALTSGQLRGAALDVFETEPLPPDHALWAMENVLVSPHCADQTDRWLHLSTRFFVDNALRFARGETLKNVVDKSAGY